MDLQVILDSLLCSESILVVMLGLIADGVLSFLLYKKSKKSNMQSNTATDDIHALIAYHENCAKKLREKFNIKE